MSTTIHLDARSIQSTGRSCPSCDGSLTPGLETCPHCGVSLRMPDPREGLELGERYRLEREIGHGGTSVVYRAHDRVADRAVAVKVLDSAHMRDPSAVSRFREEVTKARDIRHPHAAEIYDFGQMDDGTLYMVMELVRGGNLADLLERDGAMAEMRTIRLMKQVADVVGAAHRQGLVHRDLKPENIMVEPSRNGIEDWVLVLDFGIAKARGTQPTNNTKSGVLIGTPFYMSPEQCQGKPLDARSDIYALGVVMYEMLTGQRPFDTNSDSVIPLLMKHIEERPRPMHAVKPDLVVSRELERLIMGALSKDPNWRPANGAELYAALDRVERINLGKNFPRTPRTADELRRAVSDRQRRSHLARGGELDPHGASHARRRRASRGVLVLLVACASAGGWWFTSRHPRQAEAPEVPAPREGGPVIRASLPRGPAEPVSDAVPKPLLALPRPSVDVAASLELGRQALAANRWAEAAEHFEQARSGDPRNAEAWLGLGRATEQLGRPRDAAAYFRKVLEIAGQDPRASSFAYQAEKHVTEIDRVENLLRAGRKSAAAGRDAEAIVSFRDYLQNRPNDGPAHLELGRVLARSGRLVDAEVTLREAIRLEPSDAAAHHELGAALLSLNRRTEAVDELKMALDLDPAREDTKRYLALARNGGSPSR